MQRCTRDLHYLRHWVGGTFTGLGTILRTLAIVADGRGDQRVGFANDGGKPLFATLGEKLTEFRFQCEVEPLHHNSIDVPNVFLLHLIKIIKKKEKEKAELKNLEMPIGKQLY